MRWITSLVLLVTFGCGVASVPSMEPETRPSIVLTFDRDVGSGSWPSAMATFDGARAAMCPMSISTVDIVDELQCDYMVGPLQVPPEFVVDVRGDADDVQVSVNHKQLVAEASWGEEQVTYRLNIERGDTAAPDPSNASDVLRISCDQRTTTALTAVVKAQPGGIEYEVNASPEVTTLLFHHVAWEHGTAVGGETTGRWSLPIQPGMVVVACLPSDRTSYWDVEFATFELIDPDGLWVESGVDCPTTVTTRHPLEDWPMVPHERLDEVLRPEVAGLREHDVLRPVGYPDTPGMVTAYWNGLVVRAGEREALVTLGVEGNLVVEARSGSGIRARQRIGRGPQDRSQGSRR